MKFQCPKCGNIVSVDISACSKVVSCGHCSNNVRVPNGRTAPGSVIGDFVIKHEVGHGGMGLVYEAHQISLDRPAAVKILLDKYSADANFIADFVKEARSAAKLNHPNIVQAYAVGEEEGIFYFAMEFIDGETMKSVLAREGKVPIQQSAEIIASIADALDFAWNEQKLVHRDIKPDNIILMQNGRAKLADLGLAQRASESGDEDSDEVMGTPQYISPEQLTGSKLDVRSDIYSLGATFYHFVTGQFPYQGANGNAIARQHVEGTLVPPKEINPAIPDEINNIIVKMMQKKADNRYPTAAALAKELRNFCEGRDTTSRSIPPVMPTLRLPGTTGVVTRATGSVTRLNIPNAANTAATGGISTHKPVAVVPKAPAATIPKAPPAAPPVPPTAPTVPAAPKADSPSPSPAVETLRQPTAKETASSKSIKKTPKSRKEKSSSKSGLKIVMILIVLTVAGGVFHFIAVSGKVAALDFYAKLFKKGEVATAENAAKAPGGQIAPAAPKLTPEVAKAIDSVTEYRWKNPNDPLIFMDRINALLQKYPLDMLALSPKWRALYDEFAEVEEKQILDPAREELHSRMQAEINARAEVALQREAERKAAEDQRKETERARAEAARQAQIRQQQQARERAQRAAKFRAEVAKARSQLIVDLVDSNRDGSWDKSKSIMREANRYARTLPSEALPEERKALQEYAVLVNHLNKAMQDSEAITQAFANGSKALEGMQIEVSRGKLYRLVELKKNSFVGKALLGDEGVAEHPITDAIRIRMCNTVARRLKLPPHQQFFYGWRNSLWESDLQKIAPKSSYWKTNLNPYLEEYFRTKYRNVSSAEQTKLRNTYGHLDSFKKVIK